MTRFWGCMAALGLAVLLTGCDNDVVTGVDPDAAVAPINERYDGAADEALPEALQGELRERALRQEY